MGQKILWIAGKQLTLDQILTDTETGFLESSFEKKVTNIIRDWETGKKEFLFPTSGSTGKPKKIKISRERIKASAESTMEYLDPGKGSFLLCLDPVYIAGFMMIIRALIYGSGIIAIRPVSNPLAILPENESIALSAVVPLQLKKMLVDRPKFENIKNILVGGAEISKDLIEKVESVSSNIYQTFGMTETVTHFAIRRLNGADVSDHYKTMPGITIGQDKRGCLTVRGKITDNSEIVTNDLVELIDQRSFVWLGRIDNVINTGGIKIVVESLENKLRAILNESDMAVPFFITGNKDPDLGNRVVIVLEGKYGWKEINKIRIILENSLGRFEKPREYRWLETFYFMDTGKLDRIRSFEKAEIINFSE